MPQVSLNDLMPRVVSKVADDLQNNLLRKDNIPIIEIHIQPKTKLNLVNLKLSINAVNDEPTLKSFHDSL
jgi:hypothetical protein